MSEALALDRAPNPDLEVIGLAGLYVLAVVWLGRLWFTRHNVRRRRQLARGAFMDGVVALLRVVVLLVVGVLFALARASGRSHCRW